MPPIVLWPALARFASADGATPSIPADRTAARSVAILVEADAQGLGSAPPWSATSRRTMRSGGSPGSWESIGGGFIANPRAWALSIYRVAMTSTAFAPLRAR